MAYTTAQKIGFGMLLLTLLGTFSFIGYKYYTIDGKNIPFKVFKDSSGYLEFGIENGTEYCSTCDRYIYLRLAKKVNGSASVVIPNIEYKKLLKVELYKGETKDLVEFPYKIYYKSGSSWVEYPPKTASLTLSSTPKYFKVVADLPQDTGVSGNVGISITVAGNQINIEEDPLWWINGKWVNVSWLCDYKNKQNNITVIVYKTTNHSLTCPAGKTAVFDRTYKWLYCYNEVALNENGTMSQSLNFSNPYDRIDNRTIFFSVTDYQNVTSYLDIRNTTICNKVGYIIDKEVLNFSKCGINCYENNNLVQCDLCDGDSNCDGILQSGESGIKVNISSDGWKQDFRNKWKVDNGKESIKKKLRDCSE